MGQRRMGSYEAHAEEAFPQPTVQALHSGGNVEILLRAWKIHAPRQDDPTSSARSLTTYPLKNLYEMIIRTRKHFVLAHHLSIIHEGYEIGETKMHLS